MNELFELLHRGHSALEVFTIDVVAFIAVIVLIRAVIYVTKHDMAWILKKNAHTPRFLNAGFMMESVESAKKSGKKQ